jgi:neutral ceramidase
VGDLAIVSIPAEPFVEIGLALQEARPCLPTMVTGYTNGCVGYTPMPAAYPLGGYEVARSFVYPRLPVPLAPSCAGSIISAGTQLLAELDRSDSA